MTTEAAAWKKSMDRVLVGVVLSTILLQFGGLQYLLPAIGALLLLLGFRALRQENQWFRSCFVLSVLHAAYVFPLLVLQTTILSSIVPYPAALGTALTVANFLLLLALLVCLWRGLLYSQQKAGLPPHAGGALALVVWYALIGLLAFFQWDVLILTLGMLVWYVVLIYKLYKASRCLVEADYVIQPAPIRIRDRCVVLSIVACLLVGSVCGYLFGGKYPMAWSVQHPAEDSRLETIQAQLLALGFPDDVLKDLSDEDLAACADAVQVVVDVTNKPGSSRTPSVQGLRITGVGVQLPGDREQWVLFHHFLWTTDPGFYGTEAIQLWPVYRDMPDGWRAAGEVSGRVLYDSNGETFTADYFSLGTQTVTSNNILWGEQSSTDVFATFSMPRNGSNYRGYVAYPAVELQDGYLMSSWVNYVHQESWAQYPVKTAMETRMVNAWNEAGVFTTTQDALQFYPTEEGAELIS